MSVVKMAPERGGAADTGEVEYFEDIIPNTTSNATPTNAHVLTIDRSLTFFGTPQKDLLWPTPHGVNGTGQRAYTTAELQLRWGVQLIHQ